jgi:biotin transport system substrate-specific component
MIATSRLTRVPALERGITIGDFLIPVAVSERLGSRLRHAALVVAGALFIALSANLAIPVPGSPVPVTGQTFAVLLVGGALGYRRGILGVLLYLAIGLVLPVYAQHRSGIGVIGTVQDGHVVLGTNGGYLLGFVLAAALVGRLAELGWDRRIGGALGAMLLGNVVIYLIGLPWLMAAAGMDAGTAISKGLTPFLIGDGLKLLLAAGLFPVAWWVVGHRPDES